MFLEGHFVKESDYSEMSKVLTQYFTSENPLSVVSLSIKEHLYDFEGTDPLSALCDHFLRQ